MAELIESGVYLTGQRLPSVRDMATLEGVSSATVVHAFRWLEDKGLVQARPRAGYFACKRPLAQTPVNAQSQSQPHQLSALVALPAHPLSRVGLLQTAPDQPVEVDLGGTCPRDSQLFDEERVRKAVARAARLQRRSLVAYSNAKGTPALQNAVAQRALHLGCVLRSQDIVVVPSCIQAIGLCLMAVTRPGDAVAVESPTFFGFLDLLAALHLRPIEIPSHPKTGLSLPALQLALDTQPIQAVLAVPTLSNPLGAVMSLVDKKALVQMLAQRRVPLIEDVVFNDLLASDGRRRAAKSFDREGGVMVCGSFSKTLTPGIRLGWVDAGRWGDAVAALKRVLGVASNAVLEHALADVLTQSAYEAQMRRLARTMRERLSEARNGVVAHFPRGTRVSAPPAGYTLWVELPAPLSGMAMFERAKTEGIVLGPGGLFSASDRYAHCVRLSFSGPWGDAQKQALVRLGGLAHELLVQTLASPLALSSGG